MVVILGIPEVGLSEDRVEKVAWQAAVHAGCSMPNCSYTVDPVTQQFQGSASLEFPHKDSAKIFKESLNSCLEVDGFNLTLKYFHIPGERSQSGDRGDDSPSVTLIVKGMAANTSEQRLISAFAPVAQVKDIRHFPRRGFAFVQFHTVQDSTNALNYFEHTSKRTIEGSRITASFAKERDEPGMGGFQAKQQRAGAVAMSELDRMVMQQVQRENAAQALSGVNAPMWASYMQTVAQTETTPMQNNSHNTDSFAYDKESGYYLDKRAELYYDPNSTYFFTMDYKKYFIYDSVEKMLCHVGSDGKKVECVLWV